MLKRNIDKDDKNKHPIKKLKLNKIDYLSTLPVNVLYKISIHCFLEDNASLSLTCKRLNRFFKEKIIKTFNLCRKITNSTNWAKNNLKQVKKFAIYVYTKTFFDDYVTDLSHFEFKSEYLKRWPMTYEMFLYLCKHRKETLKYIRNPSEEMILHAVKSCGSNIAFVENPSIDLCRIAIDNDVENYLLIKNPPNLLKYKILRENYKNINLIVNPTPDMYLYIIRMNIHSIKFIPKDKQTLKMLEYVFVAAFNEYFESRICLLSTLKEYIDFKNISIIGLFLTTLTTYPKFCFDKHLTLLSEESLLMYIKNTEISNY